MLLSEKMRRIYILLRWYDRSKRWLQEHEGLEVPDEETKLLLELEQEMSQLQKQSDTEIVKHKLHTKKKRRYG
jgi:hypothetical protein